MTLVVSLVRTVPSAKFISGQIVTCALATLNYPLYTALLSGSRWIGIPNLGIP